jgi:uncharacterized protein YejL (UPF0352 family)
MKKKMLGTYTLQDFPPAPVQEIMNSMVGPILGALNKGAHPTEVAQIPLGNMASMLHTIYLMAHQYESILNLLYALKDQDDLANLFEQANQSPTHQGIWKDYQDLRKTIAKYQSSLEANPDLVSSLLKEETDEV